LRTVVVGMLEEIEADAPAEELSIVRPSRDSKAQREPGRRCLRWCLPRWREKYHMDPSSALAGRCELNRVDREPITAIQRMKA
jgi:hypothetical protein